MLMYRHMSKRKTTNLMALIIPNKTYKKIIERYFWPIMYKYISIFITSYLICQKWKVDKTATHGQMLTLPKISERLFERLIHYIGPINVPSNGRLYILVDTCTTTKYAIAKSYKHANAKSTVDFKIDIISQFEAIGERHSDRKY